MGRSTAPWRAALALAVDAALVLLFAGIGRASHSRGGALLGLIETAWPFLVGLLLVWGWGMVWREPVRLLRSGVPVWVGTVVLGMAMRLLSGQGTAPAFIIVATVTLGAFLLGWRGIVTLVLRIRHREHHPKHP
ncbi:MULTISPECIES: DUF3054 domain-containing protein [unclassified Leucobacter]|uniref:DUF3054 domain-containing protein n=1 Tax=unclassified Leucobacter TaxID=2621730 RepID=UPI003017D45E